jgi:hypothetical protein
VTERPHSGQHLDVEQLSAFLEGATSERERDEILVHVADCADCRELVFLMQRSAVPVTAAVEKPRTDQAWRRWLMPVGLAGAAFACGLTAIVYLRTHHALPENQVRVATVESQRSADNQDSVPGTDSQLENKNRKAQRLAKAIPATRAEADSTKGIVGTSAMHGSSGGAIGGPVPSGQVSLNASPAPGAAPPMGTFGEKNNGLTLRIEHDHGPDNGLSEVSGLVNDASGAVVADATVTLRSAPAAATRQMQTNADGRFTLSDLPPGHYELSVAAPGFLLASRQIDLKPRDLALLDSVLNVGTSAETVEVSGSNADVQVSQAPVNAATAGIPLTPRGGSPGMAVVTSGKRALSMDAAGMLLLSTDTGKHWKRVKPQWQGRVLHIGLTPASQVSLSVGGKSTSEAFELTTDAGVVWVSADGAHWRLR